ncbi:MAG TPA: glycosyltransferase family 4 protein [Candidatus Acidoferrales bacterium]|nr:glycosyltransferase family 4 protein [Candidatus Acidoferrales bacterium]
MRPLIVDLGREYRGGQHQAWLLVRGLRERGHAAELIAVRDSLLTLRAKEIGARVHVADPGRRRLTAALQIRKFVDEHRNDLVHANEPHALSSAWLARAHRAVPIVISRRIALPLSKGTFSLARYRAAARVIAVSHFVEQAVIQSGLSADRVSVIYDGVEICPEISQAQRRAARNQLGITLDIPCIGNVAAFVPEKGHALLLDAFAKVRARFPKCVLLLRGEGPELAKLQSRSRTLEVAPAVKFLPPSIDIETVFSAIDIFAFPSHAEPLGSALLAAMAHALPVTAVERGGIPEVLEDGKNGLLVQDLDPVAFSSSIARLMAHPDEAIRLGKAARETAMERFSANQMVEDTLRLYEYLAAPGMGLKSRR